jgi:phosphatidylserine/phosphatidylglycerophosphate/cardiolipin synthase-like enzyme
MEDQPHEESGGSAGKPYFLKNNLTCDFYIGTNAGGKLTGSIFDAKKSIKIVSPFLGQAEVEKLREKSLGGLDDISVITSVSNANLSSHIFALKKLIHRRKQNGENGFEYDPIRGCNLVVFRGNFIHEKLYIIDDEIAYSGSMNFTEKGMINNHETCLTINDSAIVQKLSGYFETLFKANLYKWNIAELGNKIYSVHDRGKTE